MSIGLLESGILDRAPENISASIRRTVGTLAPPAIGHCRRTFENMANTTSAKKATRKIARRTIINKSRRTQMRSSVRSVEEAIKSGDRDAALKAMANAEPELDAGSAAQHHSQEQCEPKGFTAHASDRQAGEISRLKESPSKARPAGLFVFRWHFRRRISLRAVSLRTLCTDADEQAEDVDEKVGGASDRHLREGNRELHAGIEQRLRGYPASTSKKKRVCVVTYRHSGGELFENSLRPRSNVNNL